MCVFPTELGWVLCSKQDWSAWQDRLGSNAEILQKVLQGSNLGIFLREGSKNENKSELLLKDLDGTLCQLSKDYLQVGV